MTSEDEVIVLTGATGFVGSMILERLIAQGARVAALVRGRDDAEARARLDRLAVRTWGQESALADVQAVAADVARNRLALSPSAYDALAARATAIVHCAASVRFDLSLHDAHAVNVGGTERMVELAQRARMLGGQGRFVHTSTAFVHGRMTTLGRETGPSGTPEFRNTYELTKHRAERALDPLEDAAIVRPSIVVGDSHTGWTSSFNVVYPPLRALVSGAFEIVPAPADAILDLIPVDSVVDVVCALLENPSLSGVVQAVSGAMAPTVEELARVAYAHVGLPMTTCVPTETGQVGIYAPYVDVRERFEFERAGKLGMARIAIDELLPRLLDHAVAADWGSRRVLRQVPGVPAAS